MGISRRNFLHASAAGLAASFVRPATPAYAVSTSLLRLSACDWSLHAPGPEGLQIAKAVGLDGMEVSVGDDKSDTLSIAKSEIRTAYQEHSAATGVLVSSLAMGLLNQAPFATDPRAPDWLDQSIEAAHDLKAKVVLLAFFYAGDLLNGEEFNPAAVDAAVERLKDAAPKAERLGIVLGLENWCSAAQNRIILDKVQSSAVKVYYDVGNSTHRGYNVPAEIRDLGELICQVHFKNGPDYLGEGQLDTPGVRNALRDIKYEGWLTLETSAPSGDRVADFKRNAAFLRELFNFSAVVSEKGETS